MPTTSDHESTNQTKKQKKKKQRGVRFTEDTEDHTRVATSSTVPTASKRTVAPVASAAAAAAAADGGNPQKRYKRPRIDRPNADEMDDIDDYVASDDDNDNGGVSKVSESQLLQAKRKRRLQRDIHEDDDDDDDDVDNDNGYDEQKTSLASEGIAIEPFNMDQENSDGRGYFDGDTYVFRSNPNAQDEEPDAWLESLEGREQDAIVKKEGSDEDDQQQQQQPDEEASGSSMDQWTAQELHAKMLPLVSDTETVMQAIARYGNLMKQQQQKKTKAAAAAAAKDDHDGKSSSNNTKQVSKSISMAQSALNDLTGAASALLLKGEIDIYQKTRNDLLQLLPKDSTSSTTTATTPSAAAAAAAAAAVAAPAGADVQWEYQGSQDGQIHGPYTSQQMHGWTQQGYFVGSSAVRIRPIWEETTVVGDGCDKPKEAEDLKKDLMADLMDDDDDDDDKDKKPAAVKKQTTTRGEWLLSDQVDFTASHKYRT